MARASSVLPVRAAHHQHALGDAPAEPLELLRVLEKAMISSTSSFASSMPATSLNVILFWDSLSNARGSCEAHGLPATRLAAGA